MAEKWQKHAKAVLCELVYACFHPQEMQHSSGVLLLKAVGARLLQYLKYLNLKLRSSLKTKWALFCRAFCETHLT